MTVARIGVGQINPKAGDFIGNLAKLEAMIVKAERLGVDILAFPEMSITGFPIEDLSFRGSFVKAAEAAMGRVAGLLRRSNLLVVVGGLEVADVLYSGAAAIQRGEILGWARKRHLFCCGRFSEDRYFSPGERPLVIEAEKFRAVVTLGDDLGYPVFPAEVELLINLWNDPYVPGRRPMKERKMRSRSSEDAVAMALVSMVGGSDDMVFAGSSAIIDGFGEVLARGPAFAEALVVADLDLRVLKAHRQRVFHSSRPEPHHLEKAEIIKTPAGWPSEQKKPAAIKSAREVFFKGPKELFTALVVATGDFVTKNGLSSVVVGVSGGIDSAMVASIAVEALGADRVMAISMPGPYSSRETRADARLVAKSLGTRFFELPIVNAYKTFGRLLAPAFVGLPADVTEENLQARLRGVILMAIANKHRAMVLATSNKSEAAMGYCTMYGDVVGGYAPLVDVYKTQVYELAEWHNERAGREVIPRSTIDREPTAELRPGQKDSDSLPPYPILDRVLRELLEGGGSGDSLIESGEEPEVVHQVTRMLAAAEFKRRQAPIGPTVSTRPLHEIYLPITKELDWRIEAEPASPPKKKRGARKK